MLKHANISRTSKAQQTLQLQRQWQRQQLQHQPPTPPNQQQSEFGAIHEQALADCAETPTNLCGDSSTATPPTPPPPLATCTAASFLQSLSPIKTAPQTTDSRTKSTRPHNDTAHSWNSLERPSKMLQALNTANNSSLESIVKVFAQSLSQEVDYVSLKVSPQTKSLQIIKTLLKKFRLRHRDPNLFYLTLERWIRKDGLKYKSVMLLGDETCPLQLQQCCSNPPHDDIKFTIQMRTGSLIKIFCFDIAPEARYKCLSLSTQTTVDETIELLLHCLNLFNSTESSLLLPQGATNLQHAPRLTCSPGSIGSASSASSTSSSSGMESDFPPSSSIEEKNNHNLVNNSRASSVTSISSTSNVSTISSSIIEQYCLVVECQNPANRRTLNSDEYIVDVYQNLVTDAKLATNDSSCSLSEAFNSSDSAKLDDQWFTIRLKRRENTKTTIDVQPTVMKLRILRQNLPLPPIPSLPNTLVNRNLHFNSSSLMTKPQALSSNTCIAPISKEIHCGDSYKVEHRSQERELGSRMPPPPQFIFLPPIQPRRRRNLSNVSSTFGRPMQNTNRRRYDPAQLAEDLIKLEVTKNSEVELGELSPAPPTPPPLCPNMADKMSHNFKSSAPNVHPIEMEAATTTN